MGSTDNKRKSYGMSSTTSVSELGLGAVVRLLDDASSFREKLLAQTRQYCGNDNDDTSWVTHYKGQTAVVASQHSSTGHVTVLLHQSDCSTVTIPWDCCCLDETEPAVVHLECPTEDSYQRGRVKIMDNNNIQQGDHQCGALYRAFCYATLAHWQGGGDDRLVSYGKPKPMEDNAISWSNIKNQYAGKSGTIVLKGESVDMYFVKFDDGLCWEFPGRAIVQQETIDPPLSKEQIKRHVHQCPCFTWKLEKAATSTSTEEKQQHLQSRVGGRTGFAAYPKEANMWPATDTHVFVCQIDLAKIPSKMQEMVGSTGLLQVFQEQDFDCGGDWVDGGFTRVIPASDLDLLVPFMGPLPEELAQHGEEGAIDLHWVVGWREKIDVPHYWDDFWRRNFGNPFVVGYGDDDQDDPFDDVEIDEAWGSHVMGTKFGGYGSWCQDRGGCLPVPCSYCGNHHKCEVQFNIVADGVLENLRYGDNGTVQHTWCPASTSFEKSHQCTGACG